MRNIVFPHTMLYCNTCHTILLMAISGKGQVLSPLRRATHHVPCTRKRTRLSLYKILCRSKALLRESSILLFPPPLVNPTLLKYYCTTITQYTPSYRPPPPLYVIYHTMLVMAISCKDQALSPLRCATHHLPCKRTRLAHHDPPRAVTHTHSHSVNNRHNA